ncbi:hypothetical protein EHV15_11430 [Paenibacillus oralis]|uniref:Uncharacterized protein n=1 Tax=Paenibacillus oralis TaxID=2490856 RepID=A0A3P3U047_9BACL|nr:hypothetical protein [Paenibacillus oralis]RRJ63470.1 hypothetical protein EHV15_11430 [Paenibacillus oralis]
MPNLLKVGAFIISLSVLSGCLNSNQPQSAISDAGNAQNYANEDKGTDENSEYIVFTKHQDLDPPTLSDFNEGVHVDLSKYKRSFFTDEIIDMVGKNLEAIVQHDETQFLENTNEGYKEQNLAWFNNNDNYQPGVEYDFHEVTLIEKIKDIGRINVAIAFLRKKNDGTIERGTAHYSFLQNKNGDWEITLLDAN